MQKTPTLFIDLDGTLYPNDSGLWDAMADRIHQYMVEMLGVPKDEVVEQRLFYYQTYGTTLSGIQAHYPDIDTDEYLGYVHGVPLDPYIDTDPELRTALEKIAAPKWIFTNSDRHHTSRVLSRLGIEDLFEGVIDVIDMGFIPKPTRSVYHLAMEMAGNPAPESCVFVEDSIKNLVTAKELGWQTVLVHSEVDHPAAKWRIPSIHHLPKVMEELTR